MANRKPGGLELFGRYWFPLALLALFLIAIPGLVLFGLNVFGGESSVNNWLLERYQLTYHLPLAWWLALILLLVPLAIVLLYFLKLKRQPLSVPSTFLWKKSIEDLHVNALFQWLRNNLLLILQLLVVLFLIYAFMDFRLHGRSTQGKHYIVMIDNSASMAATDIAPSRLHWAKAEAQKEIDAASDTDVGMVIVFNSSAEILQSYTNNRAQLRRAIESIQQTQRPTRIEEALTLADSLANPSRSADNNSVLPPDVQPGSERTYVAAEGIVTTVHLFSDGRFPDMPEFSLGNLNLQFHAAGKTGPENTDNLALVNFSALRDDADATKLQVFARVMNFRSSDADATVMLEVLVNGRTQGIREQKISIPARKVQSFQEQGKDEPTVRDAPGERAVIFEISDVDDRNITVLHARLEKVTDQLALDNDAWLVVGVVRKARILIVGERNDILSAFFDDSSTREVATVSKMSSADLKRDTYRKPARNGDFDLVVFDRCAPETEEDMPRGNTFFIGAPPPPWKLADCEKLANPQIKGWMAKHPVVRHLAALQEVGIAEAFKIKDLPPRTPRLIEIDQNVALLLTLGRQSFTDLVMTFGILNEREEWNTNWPLLHSFPLFLRNVIYGLGNISDGASDENFQPGQAKTIRPDVTMDEIEVTGPDGKSHRLKRGSRADFSFGQTDFVGEYKVGWDGAWQRSFAVNLLDPEESNIDPRTDVQIGAVKISSGQESRQPRELWKWLVLTAFALLLVEWYVYNKRIYV